MLGSSFCVWEGLGVEKKTGEYCGKIEHYEIWASIDKSRRKQNEHLLKLFSNKSDLKTKAISSKMKKC